MAIFSEVSENEFVGETFPVKSDNMMNTARYLANGARGDVIFRIIALIGSCIRTFDLYQNQ